ncbi:hypothetical protein CEP54_016408, partial [Fusarium duplospermum]
REPDWNWRRDLSSFNDMSWHRGDEVGVRPLRETPTWMEAIVMRENLVGMLECIKWLKTSRKDRDLTVVPGSAIFREDGKAELTFSNPDLDEGESGGRAEHELPAVAQFFLTVLVYAHLWLCKSEREGDEVEIRGPRVLSPSTIFGMLREKRYLSWTTEEDVKDFVMSLSFDPLERGEWTDSMLVVEWK